MASSPRSPSAESLKDIFAVCAGHLGERNPDRPTLWSILSSLSGSIPSCPSAPADPPAAAPILRGDETILVVEDQKEVRDFAVAALDRYGYHAIEASSAGEVLLICEREGGRIHLVLTDVVMPHASGRDLVVRLANTQPGLKVLFMSGYTDKVIVHRGVLDQGAHFIQKPFSPKELAKKVRAILGPTNAIDPYTCRSRQLLTRPSPGEV